MLELPGARPFAHDGGRVGVVLCHGFTGSPASLRPWAEFLADEGVSVRLPRLPGHGTQWRDLQLTRWTDWFATVEASFDELRARCDRVFVCGLSMGATLALRLAQTRGEQVAGLVLVNPSLLSLRRSMVLLPVLEKVRPSVRGIGNDTMRPHVDEGGYDRTPLRALRSLTRLWAVTRADLALVDQPLLVYRSAVDHVVEPASTAVLLSGVRSLDVEERVLRNSYHVATLDNDAELIFRGSLEFVRRLSTGAANSPFAVQD
ncbi:MAG TPA: alpha/beta fold hydrolase [Acidothermaceae bacterium]